MKKALTDTGLIKKADEVGATKRKSSGKKGGKAVLSSVSAPKPKKTAEPKKPRKQGGKGRPFQPKPWEEWRERLNKMSGGSDVYKEIYAIAREIPANAAVSSVKPNRWWKA